MRRLGRPGNTAGSDILVNSAGMGIGGPLEDYSGCPAAKGMPAELLLAQPG